MLENVTNSLSNVVRMISGKSSITEKNVQDAVEQIKISLLDADVNVRVVRRFINQTLEEATGGRVLSSVQPGQQFIKIVYDKMVALLGTNKYDLNLKGPDTTSVILLYGLQGSGKTTTAGKLALRLKKQGRRVMLVAADLVRPAAVDQLVSLGQQVDVPVYVKLHEKDPVSVAKHALAQAKKEQYNTLIIDTSGRMQLDEALMKELLRIKDVTNPTESLLVLDAMTGQQAVEIAQKFDATLPVTGFILTKFDSDTRGGAALSLRSLTQKPIVFMGTGEKLTDLEIFYPERIAGRILGMGDIVSLVEQAQEVVKEEEAEALQRKMASGDYTLEDYLEQHRQIKKMGSVQKIAAMLPGVNAAQLEEGLSKNDMKHDEAILLSMTPTERRNYHMIGPSRRKRIAHGSGTSVHAVNQLIKKFEKIRQSMYKLTRNKKQQEQFMKMYGMAPQ